MEQKCHMKNIKKEKSVNFSYSKFNIPDDKELQYDIFSFQLKMLLILKIIVILYLY